MISINCLWINAISLPGPDSPLKKSGEDKIFTNVRENSFLIFFRIIENFVKILLI